MLLLFLAAPAAARAATITVDSTADPAGASGCALRDAITAANTDADVGNCVASGTYGDDTIDITATGTITLSGTLPDLTTNVAIVGPGASQLALDGAGSYRVLSAQNLTTTSVSDLTVRNGKAPVSGGGARAGGILSGGDMTLDRVIVTGNTAAVNGTPDQFVEADGGGIEAGGGTLTLIRSTVSDNHATLTGSGNAQLFANGGGVRLDTGGTLVLDRSTVSGNDATATITGGIDPAYTRPSGGGIYSDGTLMLDRSTIAGNSAVGTGGSASSLPDFPSGGGVYEDSGTFVATSATIADNSAGFGGANLELLQGGSAMNTLVAHPQGGAPNCYSTMASQGYNLEDDAGASCGFDGVNHDLVGVDPLLDPAGLANNGGPTRTIALELGSPAVDQGKSFGATVDQRDSGFPRITDSPTIANATGGDGGDIGAFERDSIPPDTSLDVAEVYRSKHKAKFKFSSTKTGSTFMCKLDHKPFKSCNSPKIYTGLDHGKHTFKVEAVDASGNPDPEPVKQVFRI